MLPVGSGRYQLVSPDLDCALLDRRPQITGHERQPLDLALGRLLWLVRMCVADVDDRLVGLVRHSRGVCVNSTLRVGFSKSRRHWASRAPLPCLREKVPCSGGFLPCSGGFLSLFLNSNSLFPLPSMRRSHARAAAWLSSVARRRPSGALSY